MIFEKQAEAYLSNKTMTVILSLMGRVQIVLLFVFIANKGFLIKKFIANEKHVLDQYCSVEMSIKIRNW